MKRPILNALTVLIWTIAVTITCLSLYQVAVMLPVQKSVLELNKVCVDRKLELNKLSVAVSELNEKLLKLKNEIKHYHENGQ